MRLDFAPVGIRRGGKHAPGRGLGEKVGVEQLFMAVNIFYFYIKMKGRGPATDAIWWVYMCAKMVSFTIFASEIKNKRHGSSKCKRV